MEKEIEVKGVFGGNCNITACQKPVATWYNHSTRAYYCPACANRLNLANYKDAHRLFGHDLCTQGRYSPQENK